ncbi:hypothetical protein BsWGS_21664 [Bradybaena similaris]
MDKPLEQHQFQRGSKDKTHSVLRNISTAPALISVSTLDAVMEEDEHSTQKELLHENKADIEIVDEIHEVALFSEAPSLTRFKQSSNTEILASQIPENQNKGSSHKSIIQKLEFFQENIVSSKDRSLHCDIEKPHQQNCIDMLYVDVISDKEWDTDLESEDPPMIYDHTGKTAYLEACRKLKVVPTTYFLRHINDNHLSMKHHDLTGDEMKAVAVSLATNTTITVLDLSDNWLGQEAGLAICEALRENCFITDLNLSDNHLSLCAEKLCHIIKQNNTLSRVNISGNGFDDQCAGYLSDLIMYTTKLEYLNLSHNNLGERAGLLLGPAISENLCMKELDLSWNQLRRDGAVAVIAGIKNNVYMKRVNLSWNGFGIEGSVALKDALKANNVLEEIDLTNNRITTEGAVLIGKGLLTNETLKVFKLGKNPVQSSGCWGIAAAILRNPNCMLQTLDFTDIPINNDFMDLWKQVEEQFPNMKMVHGEILHKEHKIKFPVCATLRPVTS